MTEAAELDYYLVLTGPKATAKDVRTNRAWRIDAVYLFDSQRLLAEQHARGVKVGVASGVRVAQWLAARSPAATRSCSTPDRGQRRRLATSGGCTRGGRPP